MYKRQDVIGIELEAVNFAAEYRDRVFADFLREYQQVMALTPATRFSASELVSEVLRGEVPRWDAVLVDDAQHLAPAPAEFVRRLLSGADLGVVGGDVAQSIFHFRGASPRFFHDLGGLDHQVIDLGESRLSLIHI